MHNLHGHYSAMYATYLYVHGVDLSGMQSSVSSSHLGVSIVSDPDDMTPDDCAWFILRGVTSGSSLETSRDSLGLDGHETSCSSDTGQPSS